MAAYGGQDNLQMIDSSSIRVHQHGANSKKRGTEATGSDQPDLRCMGRSRGGLTTKIHALEDAHGLPIRLKITHGQAHDGRSATDMLDDLGGCETFLADRAYDSDALRAGLTSRGIIANLRAMPNRVRAQPFSKHLYRYRNAV